MMTMKINVHYILIIIECHVYIVVLNVLYDDVQVFTNKNYVLGSVL